MLQPWPLTGSCWVHFCTRDYVDKRKGISWTLLEHVAHLAKSKGFETLESIEARDHHEAIEMEREMGFTASASPGDPTLIVLRVKLDQR